MDDNSLEKLSKVLRDPTTVTLEPKDTIDAESPVPHQPNESKAELTEENLVKLQEIEEEEGEETARRKGDEEESEGDDKVDELPAGNP